MAKAPKKRTKKYNPKQAMDTTALHIANNAINRMAFVASSIRQIAPWGGRGFQLTTTRQQRIIAGEILVSALFEQPRTWNVWLGHYYDTPNGIDVDTRVMRLEDYTLEDFTDNVDLLIDNTRDKRYKQHSYALYACPNDHFDLAEMDDGLVDNFIHSGLFTEALRLTPEQRTVTKHDMLLKLLADNGKFDVNKKHVVEVEDFYVQKVSA